MRGGDCYWGSDGAGVVVFVKVIFCEFVGGL